MCTSAISNAFSSLGNVFGNNPLGPLGSMFGGGGGNRGIGSVLALAMSKAQQPAADPNAADTPTQPKVMVSPEDVARRREAMALGRVPSRNPLRLTVGGTDATGLSVPGASG